MDKLGAVQLVIVIIFSIILDYLLVSWFGKRWVSTRRERSQKQGVVRVFGGVSPLISSVRYFDYRLAFYRLKLSFIASYNALPSILRHLIALQAARFSRNKLRITGILKSNKYLWVKVLEIGLILIWAIWVGRGIVSSWNRGTS